MENNEVKLKVLFTCLRSKDPPSHNQISSYVGVIKTNKQNCPFVSAQTFILLPAFSRRLMFRRLYGVACYDWSLVLSVCHT